MLKKHLSDSTRRWLKIFLIIYVFMWLFYLLTNAGFFLYVNAGMCFGIAILVLTSFIEDKKRERAFHDLESKMNTVIELNSEER